MGFIGKFRQRQTGVFDVTKRIIPIVENEMITLIIFVLLLQLISILFSKEHHIHLYFSRQWMVVP